MCIFQLTQSRVKYLTADLPDPASVWHYYKLCGGAEMEGPDQSRVPPSCRKLQSFASSSCGFTNPSLSPHSAHQPPHQDSTLSLATNRWGDGERAFFHSVQTLTCGLYKMEHTDCVIAVFESCLLFLCRFNAVSYWLYNRSECAISLYVKWFTLM